MKDSAKDEKWAMLVIAGLSVVGLCILGMAAIYNGIDAGGATLVGVIAAALAAGIKDIIAAIRGYSMSAQLGKVTDQLAASAPTAPPDAPIDAPTDAADGGQVVADQAQDPANALKPKRKGAGV